VHGSNAPPSAATATSRPGGTQSPSALAAGEPRALASPGYGTRRSLPRAILGWCRYNDLDGWSGGVYAGDVVVFDLAKDPPAIVGAFPIEVALTNTATN